jgi:hypothetical protein
MKDAQPLDNWIANYEAGQRQRRAQFLRAIKLEFYKLRDTQRRERQQLLTSRSNHK